MRLARRASLLVAFYLLAGCGSTLSELRQAPPQRTATIIAERPGLVSCIISGLRAADPGTFRVLAGGLIYQTRVQRAPRSSVVDRARVAVRCRSTH
jgi:hypothetical protein